ncbi:MAG: leucine-rich repeat protein [Acutalibacteraceae bacterium]
MNNQITDVKYVGNWAVDCDQDVTSVSIKSGTVGIADGAFYYCISLENITIPNSVTSIGNSAFYYCESLKSIIIPSSITSIGGGAFSKTPLLNNQTTDVKYAGKWVVDCDSNATSVSIKSGAVGIADLAFENCSNLTSITIPNSVVSIGDYAFYKCSSLTSITIPDSVVSIEDYAFYKCSSLTSITIPDSVVSIEDYAFYKCSSLTSITIPNSVVSIEDYAFYKCSSLTSITIPNSVVSIEDYAFYKCSSLTSITIPNSVVSIEDYAFYKCSSLTSITIPDSVTNIGDYAFYDCTSLTSVTIGNGVTSIGERAFEDCIYLTSLIVGNSVTSIGECAFYRCTNLTEITIPDSVTSIADEAFGGCSSLEDVYYTASEEEWNKISIGSYNDKLVNATIHYNYDPNHTHSYISKITRAATCIAAGVKTFICSCGDTYTKTIPATGHKDKTTTTKATTTKDGKAVTACEVCGVVSKTVTIYKASSVKLSKTSYTYNGKVQKPTVIVKNSKGTTLKNGTDYTVSYASGCKNTGKYAVKITFKGNYSGSKTLYFNILPSKTSKLSVSQTTSSIKATWKAVTGATGYKVTLYNAKGKAVKTVDTTKTTYTFTKLSKGTTYKVRVTAYKTIDGKKVSSSVYTQLTTATKPGTPTLKVKAGAKKASLSWNKQTGASGYVVYMATSKNGTYKKIATVKGGTKVSYTKTGLTKSKTYYFKVKAYKTVDGKNIYGAYSAVKSVKIK